MEGYVVGQVAAVLSKPGGENQIDSKLNALFTVKPKLKKKKLLEESLEVPDPPLKKKKDNKNESSLKTDSKLRKNKNKAGEPDSLKTNKTTENIQGIDEEATETVHWSKLTGAARRVALKTQKPKHNTSKDHRTIFIGNLPIRLADKMKLKKLFSKYGAIENLRFRCPPTKDMTTSKRVAMIKKEFHPEKKNLIAYVCYKEEFSAEKALQMNGKEVDGYHLRVDISTNNSKSNHNKSVFVGNLPFDVNEEDIRKMFKVCGDIENIRIIRDNKTGFGKGFCYVVFKTKDCVELALKLDGNVLNKRELRVKRCMRERPEKHKISFSFLYMTSKIAEYLEKYF
ncbi:hypothetical protein SNE40_014053 [Patella caerulea]|uniref:RRM domain-containing protein n=1 Tax=Patella caerulea TaxID=87958 RepID=A0AAN8JDT2_PATCE